MSDPRSQQRAAVYVRQRWADDWTLLERVYAERFSLVAGPDVSEAVLHFNYGFVQPAESINVLARAKQNLNGWFVRIELTQFTEDDPEAYLYWYGIVVQTTAERDGTLTIDGETAETGKQKFLCRGLEFLLQRTIVDSSFVRDSDGAEIEIGRAIAFNLGPGRSTDHQRKGNKDAAPGDADAPIFAFDIGVGGVKTESTETLWSVQDIITYLFHYHPPEDAESHDNLNWTVADGGDAEILSKIYPTVQAQNKSVKNLLDELIDRRRLIGYTINVVGDDEKPKLDVFTFNKDAIALPGGTTIPPNSSQQTWFFDDDPKIQVTMSEDDATRYDVVIVRGAPLTATCTVGDSRNGSIVKDWTDEQKDTYNNGASDMTSYADLKKIDKQGMNQAFRADDTFAKVFKGFLIDPHWDGKLNGVIVCPDPLKETGDGDPSEVVSEFWYPGLRLLDKLPLRTDYDYSTVDDFEATSLTIDSSQPDYLRPFGIAPGDFDDDDLPIFYYRLDNPGRGKIAAETLSANGRIWSAALRMQDDCPGFIVDVHGEAQHVLAKVEFVPADDDDEIDTEAQVDWKDCLFTICIEFDQHVEARWPEGELTATEDVLRELIIDVPQYRLDYLAPGTIIGIDYSASKEGDGLATDGGYVRDDRAIMEDMARCAFAWYGQTRHALTITQHDLVCQYRIGDLLTQVGNETTPAEVNSVVTKIEFDLLTSTVTVHTQFAELDFSR